MGANTGKFIEVIDARQHNLKGINLNPSLGGLIVVTVINGYRVNRAGHHTFYARGHGKRMMPSSTRRQPVTLVVLKLPHKPGGAQRNREGVCIARCVPSASPDDAGKAGRLQTQQ
jgi:hypothetical protein